MKALIKFIANVKAFVLVGVDTVLPLLGIKLKLFQNYKFTPTSEPIL